jgi:hypothetical protein
MKKTLINLSFLSVLVMLFAFGNPEKKINKLISKIWKDQPTTLHLVDLPDSLDATISQLHEIQSDNEVLGYACYTSAFGCRIGGCAAPGSPNVDGYEAFDYIVIYDKDMSILKVDIANYGGQYGYEICRKNWLAQFIGQTMGFRLEDNIDGISGATVSASYLIDDLNQVGKTLKILQESKTI